MDAVSAITEIHLRIATVAKISVMPCVFAIVVPAVGSRRMSRSFWRGSYLKQQKILEDEKSSGSGD
jgi:hypothetical protein